MRKILVVLLLYPLAACGGGDFARPGTWQASGVNDANLRLMLADPQDAMRGRAAATDRAQPGSLAIQRLERDRRRSLPDSRAARIGGAPATTQDAPMEPSGAR
ncbi:hypothetical protein ACLF3G_08180 [Falsiroseomonas sp. HC035]|uniref:hypothetical protein n=1 Tax=Falsiroseomonas sp. HC035 TaxID=3390999 RepID=UPI003D31C7AF